MQLQSPQRGDQHRGIGPKSGLPALDVEELLGAQIGAEARLGDHVICELERSLGGHHRVATMSDVRERPTVDDGWIVLERLDEIRLEGILQECRHRTFGGEVSRRDGLAAAVVADDDVAEPALQVLQILGQAKNRHHLRRHGDVVSILAGITIAEAT